MNDISFIHGIGRTQWEEKEEKKKKKKKKPKPTH